MGKSNRIRANRSQSKIAAPVKAKKKQQGMPSWLLSLIIILVTVAVLATVVGGVLSSNGVILRMRKGVYSENYSFSGSMMNYYYHLTYQNFDSNYETYMSYFGLNPSASLKNQIFGDESVGGYEKSYLGEFDGTWYDYIMSLAVSSVEQILVYCEEADARGITLTDEDYDAIDAEIETLKEIASTAGYSTTQYLAVTYGNGVKVSDVKKVIELTRLASKAMEVVQTEILDAIKDTDITDKYNANKDNYDLVDYMYYTASIKYENVAKEILGSDYTADELAAKKTEVDAEYNKRVDEAKKVVAALKEITDKDAFIKYILNYVADTYYDEELAKETIADADRPEAEVAAALKTAMIEKIIAEVLEGKTETDPDTVENGDKATLYGQTVALKYAQALGNVKKAVFANVVADNTRYNVKESTYVSTNDFSKWAFESGRKVGEIKSIENNEKPEEQFVSSVYMLTKTRYLDEAVTKNIAYMLFSSESLAKSAIAEIKKAELSLDKFNEMADGLSASGHSTLEEYIEGTLGVDSFDAWAYSDTIKVGDITEEPIVVEADTTYLVGYYYEEADLAWKVNVKSEIFTERYNAAYDAIKAKFATTSNEGTLNSVSDGYLPAGLQHSHSGTSSDSHDH